MMSRRRSYSRTRRACPLNSLILLWSSPQSCEDLLIFWKPAGCLLAEDQLFPSGDLEDPAFSLDELGASLELLFDGLGQTDRARLVVSLNAVLYRNIQFGRLHNILRENKPGKTLLLFTLTPWLPGSTAIRWTPDPSTR